MRDQDTRGFFRQPAVAQVGTCHAWGWPYVVPLMYVYEEASLLYLHTGPQHGHFLANIQENPRICIQVNETGPMHRGQPSPCNSALVYKSVIACGTVRVVDGPAAAQKKAWFRTGFRDAAMNRRRLVNGQDMPCSIASFSTMSLYDVALRGRP